METKGKSKGKVGKVMHEFKHGELHSGSKHGPKVKSRAQAIAIGLSEARARGAQKSHGFGHPAHLRHGKLRVSGMAGAHRLGKGK